MQNKDNRAIETFKTRISLAACICLFFISAGAQQLKASEYSIGAYAATNGYGLQADIKITTKSDFTHSLLLSTQTIIHPKETKVQNSLRANPKPYVFGKLNAGGAIRLSYVLEKQIGTPSIYTPNLILGISGGPSLGILKPYFVGYQDPDNLDKKPDLIQQNDVSTANQNYIYGPASWTKGFKSLYTTAGLHIDTHLKLKWKSGSNIQNWTTGVRLDVLTTEYKILYNSDKQLFTSIYTAYSLGQSRM